MKTADQPLQRPPAALTRSSCRAEWIGTAQDGASQQAPRTDVDASAELSDREKFVRALSRDSAQGAPRGENRESSAVMRRRQVKRLGYQAHHIRSLHFRIYLPVTRFGCGDNRRTQVECWPLRREPQPPAQHGSRAAERCRSRARPGQRLPPCMHSGGTSRHLLVTSPKRARAI